MTFSKVLMSASQVFLFSSVTDGILKCSLYAQINQFIQWTSAIRDFVRRRTKHRDICSVSAQTVSNFFLKEFLSVR